MGVVGGWRGNELVRWDVWVGRAASEAAASDTYHEEDPDGRVAEPRLLAVP